MILSILALYLSILLSSLSSFEFSGFNIYSRSGFAIFFIFVAVILKVAVV